MTCSISWCQNNDSIHKLDSVIVAVSALRIANAKMIELKYEKEINKNLVDIINTDSIIIDALNTNLDYCKREAKETTRKYKKQRNRAIEIGAGSSALFLVLLIIALI